MSWDNFLSDKLKSKQYSNKADAKKDILNVLKRFNELHPEEDVYVHNDGTTKNLLSLRGTIPVNFKGSTYNIPVQIWLLNGHPFTAPLVFVRPTSAMVVKPSKHVDQAGRVYMPYLTEWRAPKSDTVSMINILSSIFSQESPVYSKPTNVPPPRPNPPYQQPHQGMGYPIQPQGMPMPGMPQPSYGGYPGSQPYPNQQQSTVTPYPTAGSSYPVTSSYQQTAQLPPPRTKLPERQSSVISEEHLRASLLSTAEDKLKRRVKEVFEMGKMELSTLQATQNELTTGNRDLTEMITKMKDEKANLNSNVSLLTQKNNDIEEVLKKLESDSASMNIDEAVVTTAPLYNQILNLFAEENAVEDAIYYLSDALRREVVELDAYLKAVRTLSRKQFMLRATLQKARKTAGLSQALIGH